MKVGLAEAAGHVCQSTSPSPITLPRSRSFLATSTSTVASGGGGGAAGGGAASRWLLAMYAATPPAARATPRTTRRAAFITLHFPHDNTAGAAVIAGFDTLNVKAWLMRRIQSKLMLRCSGLAATQQSSA